MKYLVASVHSVPLLDPMSRDCVSGVRPSVVGATHTIKGFIEDGRLTKLAELDDSVTDDDFLIAHRKDPTKALAGLKRASAA